MASNPVGAQSLVCHTLGWPSTPEISFWRSARVATSSSVVSSHLLATCTHGDEFMVRHV